MTQAQELEELCRQIRIAPKMWMPAVLGAAVERAVESEMYDAAEVLERVQRWAVRAKG